MRVECPLKSVAILTPWFPNLPGDPEGAFILDSALALTQVGWKVGILVVRPWVPPFCQRLVDRMWRGEVCVTAFKFATLRVVRVPTLPRVVLRSLTDIVSDRIITNALDHMVRSISADVVHVQTEGFGPIAVNVARRLRVPLVVTVHGLNMHPRYLHSSYQKQRLRSGLACADRVVLVGEPLRDFFRRYIGGNGNFQIVPNGIDCPRLRRDGSILQSDPLRLISVSTLEEGKGVDLTLFALAQLRRKGISNWTYRIIGEGPRQAALLKLTTDLRLADKVTFVGRVRHAEIFDHLACGDIFVLPSYREAFGIAYLEAMAAGLLTIGVIGQGPSQFIRDGENGLLVPPRDVDALVVVLRNILTGDRQLLRNIASEGQRTAQNSYTWDNHARQLVDLYEEVIGKCEIDHSANIPSPGAVRFVSGKSRP